MSKYSGYRSWVENLYKKENIDISDIDKFGSLFFKSIQNAQRLYNESLKISDNALKASLNILAIEEIAKPIILSEILPSPNKKWVISLEVILEFIKQLTDHSIKQMTTSDYGKFTNKFEYTTFFTEDEIKILEKVKEMGFYVDIKKEDFSIKSPLDTESILSKELAEKLLIFTKERLDSFIMYKSELEAVFFVRLMSFIRIFEMTKHFREFLQTNNFDEIKNFKEIISLASSYKPAENGPDVIIYVNESLGNVENQIIHSVKHAIMNDKMMMTEPMTSNQYENFEKLKLIIRKELST